MAMWNKIKDAYSEATQARLTTQQLRDSACKGIINLIPKPNKAYHPPQYRLQNF